MRLVDAGADGIRRQYDVYFESMVPTVGVM